MDSLLKMLGLGEDVEYSDLNDQEKITYEQLSRKKEEIENAEITGENIKDYITQMKNAVSSELADLPSDEKSKERNTYLKARLKNYILLEELLFTPDKAKKMFKARMKASGIKSEVNSII